MKSVSLFLLKAFIAGLSIYFIYKKVITRPDFDQLLINLRHTFFNTDNLPLATLLVCMMCANWMLESIKWKLLLVKIETAGFIKSLRSVLTGVTIGLFTPNRVGEFAGRVMHLKPGIRIKASIAAIIGSMNQLLITIVCGGFGLILSLNNYLPDNIILVRVISLLLVVAIAALVFFYFRLPGIHKLAAKFSSLRKLTLYTRVFELYNPIELFKLSLLSALRYLIFTFQYILMLQMFGIQIDFYNAFRLISVIYLVLAVVPSIAITEITVRGSVALYFFAPLTGNSAGILAASSLLWLLNLVIPAVIGAMTVFYFRFNK